MIILVAEVQDTIFKHLIIAEKSLAKKIRALNILKPVHMIIYQTFFLYMKLNTYYSNNLKITFDTNKIKNGNQ